MIRATIYDVAREAGVSIATVSHVINGKGKISRERREEILDIMKRLNYRPNAIASALAGKRTFTLGLLVPDISNPFFAEMARSVEDQGHQLGYSVIICSTDNQEEKVKRYVNLLRQKQVDGVIIGTGISHGELLKPLQEHSLAIALIARDNPALDASSVRVHDLEGGRLAAEHLLQLGHRRLAVLAENERVTSSSERVRGFVEAAASHGLELSPGCIAACDHKIEDGYRRAKAMLELAVRPTALFCCNDLLAVGALRAARELGLRVPEECSVVSFDDTILASVTDPPLTVIAQPIEQMGRMAVDLVVRGLSGKGDPACRIVLPPELIVRQSTTLPPA
ncbi:transcriptional regulator, LacI family [Paenibacillus sp. cl141a]|uniref:LacI family DNA-binding transcriptional regulator n=1 Tax=Paenibacillus sp. cl141a TaxID=1761877 RepID=UPI0008D76064|nr:LacI family DNA-binding transcriptional regulator [Paenibacillus sp. cl141a]SEK47565.1 transcriptional regulator, LacI family [Paenibacillus sp. cl141a]